MPYFHVRLLIEVDSIWADTETIYELDLSEDDVELLGRQYREGSKIFFKGKWIDSSLIKEIEIRKTSKRAREYAGWGSATGGIFYEKKEGEDVTRTYIMANQLIRKHTSLSNQVFIVHGRDKQAALELEKLLEKEFRLEVILLQDKPHSGRTIIEKLEHYSNVGYAFVIITPDDVGAFKGERLKDRPRQNVIFEWGHFIAKLGRQRTCILLKGNIELPSDMHGMGYHRFHDSIEEVFLKIKRELKSAKIIK